MPLTIDELEDIDSTEDQVSIFGREMIILGWNKNVVKRYKIPAVKAVNKSLFFFFPHAKTDYRIKCFCEVLEHEKEFYFTGLPLEYSVGCYSQVIVPLRHPTEGTLALSIVREHSPELRFTRAELLTPLLKKPFRSGLSLQQ